MTEQRQELRYYYGRGGRKSATAQVRVYPGGNGRIIVNDRPAEEYFPRWGDIHHITEPLEVVGLRNQVTITVRVKGSGLSGQAGAIRHGISRALLEMDPSLRPTLRKGGYLTRDARAKERKKPGLKRARKAPQYTKR